MWIQPNGLDLCGAGAIIPARGAAVGNRFLVQQKFGGLHARIAVEPSLYNPIVEEVSDREQAHTLMMSHPAAYQFVAMKPRASPGGREVSGLIKAIRT